MDWHDPAHADPERFWEGLFLVDTGAIDSLVPDKHLTAIGLVPKAKRTYELTDGSELKMDITTGDLEFMGDIVGSTIIFGPDDAEPILKAIKSSQLSRVNEESAVQKKHVPFPTEARLTNSCARAAGQGGPAARVKPHPQGYLHSSRSFIR